ncbi:MAG: hypothetical protein V3T88_01850 [Nitrosomonadaceae bacterium]
MDNPFTTGDAVAVRYRGYPTLTFKYVYIIINTQDDWCWVRDNDGDAYRVRYPLFKRAGEY